MTDLIDLLSTLHRPRLLIRAARFGLNDYDRHRDLRRLTGIPHPPSPEAALRQLIADEAELDLMRREGAAGYNLARHVELLIAMMAEARLLPRPAPRDKRLGAT